MSDDQLVNRAQAIVQRILYVTVASVDADGRPWNSPVYSSFDDDGRFFWASSPRGQHSLNVTGNGRGFLVIYDSTVPEGTGEGVYIDAHVEAIDELDDIKTALHCLNARVGKQQEQEPERFLDGGLLRVYRATPKCVWMNDEETNPDGNYVRDVRVEIPASVLRNLTSW